jgi:hypothetical protein
MRDYKRVDEWPVSRMACIIFIFFTKEITKKNLIMSVNLNPDHTITTQTSQTVKYSRFIYE